MFRVLCFFQSRGQRLFFWGRDTLRKGFVLFPVQGAAFMFFGEGHPKEGFCAFSSLGGSVEFAFFLRRHILRKGLLGPQSGS